MASNVLRAIGDRAFEEIGLVITGLSCAVGSLREGVQMSKESCWLDSV